MSEMKTEAKGGSFLLKKTSAQHVYTPEDLTDEHRMIAQTAKQFIEKEVDPYHNEIEQQDFNKVVELMHKAGELGLLAHSIPETYGGLGLDKVSKGLVGEIIGRTSGYGVAHSNHTCIATLPITYFGTKKQKEKYLPKLASGEYIGAYCLTEPEAGSDALAAQTKAVLNPKKTHYVLNGTKQYITNAAFSDTFITYAKVDGEHFTAFIVEKGFEGLSLGPEEKKMGIKGSSTRPVIYEDCLVPVENVLGQVGKGHLIALNVLNLGRFNLGSACMGAAKYAFELALAYTKERKQFKTAIAEFNASKEKIAKMAARIFASESIQYRTAGLLEEALGGLYESENHKLVAKQLAEFAMECSVCKVYGSETLDLIADESLQLHGGAGFIQEYKIEQVYRDSRINRIFEGTNEINRLLLPTQLLKKADKGEIELSKQVEHAVSELMSGQWEISSNELLAREKQAVITTRYLFLALLGTAFQTFNANLAQEQETLMKLAEIAVGLFAIESSVLRAEKAVNKNGEEKEKLKSKLSATVVSETLFEIEKQARQLINGMLTGEKHRQYRTILGKWMNDLQSEGEFTRNRDIAREFIDSGRYVV
ncbi:acyl-CoA dehydrogenase family protein [Priestia megaterium]|uniref:acyl-CoA dehydrogenase family protein n=1 Tax=Priestia megaterium TaxID=1404 RepID=UPI0013E3307F|nr:acyl-CoA dehydrogenase family protein [Priestia megaterium]MED3864652.1 acyl-CoA dehydrogenase family protein [Priestia megaterium]MED4097921.1 acyl-CoA dehydrogenase family protein [Priestia megaterium]MED4141793.1 acyl-CoA dehydrogenase family protein [Priestia megaterium]MED4165136.1 acyl-CoA dehydrogenase family protein [Priestia megaterium]MED4200627.1 acyl-CoA dehydrogenase family protein [Priestia megaterium]